MKVKLNIEWIDVCQGQTIHSAHRRRLVPMEKLVGEPVATNCIIIYGREVN